MAALPSPEDSARYILRILVGDSRGRPGDVLRANNFLMAFSKAPWRASDFKPGMEYAAQQGWVEILPEGYSFRLTDIGFANAGEKQVNLTHQCNEKVTIERRDGSKHENVPALVTGKMILIPDEKVPIAVQDAILRELPSGLVERLTVIDPGFHARIHGLPAHYQVKYRQEGQAPAGTPGYVVHVAGDNARVNIHSVDNSNNTVVHQAEGLGKLAEELARLRMTLAHAATEPEQHIAIGAVASAELAAKNGDSSRVSSALSAVGSAGKWAFDVATEIGVHLAAAVLKTHLGLPPG